MSKIEIINRALLKLGEPPVSSLNDAAFGQSYDMIYQDVKNLMLSSYPWRFAVIKKRVARKEEKYGERFMYQLPADCLLLIKVWDMPYNATADVHVREMSPYELVNGAIVAPVGSGIDIEYVSRIDDDAAFPPLFREAMAAKIAAELSMRLKHSISFKQVFDNEFYNLIRQAELNNEIVKTSELMPDNSWMTVRQLW